MLVLTQRLPAGATLPVVTVPPLILALTAEERTRSRHRFTTEEGIVVYLRLPRGTVLQQGDWLSSEGMATLAAGPGEAIAAPFAQRSQREIASAVQYVQVQAKAEPVLTVTASSPLALLRAVYHLGNRHVPLEISPHYVRLAPDPVLQAMLTQLGVSVLAEMAPFAPEMGAYHASHAHALGHPGHPDRPDH